MKKRKNFKAIGKEIIKTYEKYEKKLVSKKTELRKKAEKILEDSELLTDEELSLLIVSVRSEQSLLNSLRAEINKISRAFENEAVNEKKEKAKQSIRAELCSLYCYLDIEEPEVGFVYNDFILSVANYLNTNGRITDRQESSVRRTIEDLAWIKGR